MIPTPTKRERRNAAREARYGRAKRAEVEVLRRLALAVHRINVASQSNGGNPAQFLHAAHYLSRGWTGSWSPENDSLSVPRDAPYFMLGDHEAEVLALALHQMFTIAKNAERTVEEADE